MWLVLSSERRGWKQLILLKPVFFNALLRQRVKETVSHRRGNRTMWLINPRTWQLEELVHDGQAERGLGLVLVVVFIKFVIIVIVLSHVRDGGLHPRAAVVGVVWTGGHRAVCPTVTVRETEESETRSNTSHCGTCCSKRKYEKYSKNETAQNQSIEHACYISSLLWPKFKTLFTEILSLHLTQSNQVAS